MVYFQKKKGKGGNTSQLILWGQYYTDTKTKDIHKIKKENYKPVPFVNIVEKTLNIMLAN